MLPFSSLLSYLPQFGLSGNAQEVITQSISIAQVAWHRASEYLSQKKEERSGEMNISFLVCTTRTHKHNTGEFLYEGLSAKKDEV